MTTTKPSPLSWTLRFKRRKETILLHVDPLQTLTSIKQTLADVWRDVHGSINDTDTTASDILLGLPLDKADLTKGFRAIETDSISSTIEGADGEKFDDDLFGETRSKHNPSKSSPNKTSSKGKRKSKGLVGVEDCPKTLGLRDGGVMAFRFRSDPWKGGQGPEDEGFVDEEAWDVEVPTLDDCLGEETVREPGAAASASGL